MIRINRIILYCDLAERTKSSEPMDNTADIWPKSGLELQHFSINFFLSSSDILHIQLNVEESRLN